MNVPPKEYPPLVGGPAAAAVAVEAPSWGIESDSSILAEAMMSITTDMLFRQSSVLDTPPIFDALRTPMFPHCNDASRSMESGLFNALPPFVDHSNNSESNQQLGSTILDTSSQNMIIEGGGGVTSSTMEPITTSLPSTLVQAFDQQYLFMESKDEGGSTQELIDDDAPYDYDPPMPIVRATSHDHAYVNNQSEDYQILRDFLTLGEEIGVVPDPNDDELNALIGTMDFGNLVRSTSYMDTWNDLGPMIDDPNDDDQQQEQQQQPTDVQAEVEIDAVQEDQYPEESIGAVVEYEEQSNSVPFDDQSNGQFDYSPSPAPSFVSTSTFSATTPRPSTSGGRVTKKSARSKPSTIIDGGKKGGALVKDEKYWERRRKNNVASARSRQTRKEKAVEIEMEREQLEMRNRHLKEELARLTRMVDEHKRKFFTAFKK